MENESEPKKRKHGCLVGCLVSAALLILFFLLIFFFLFAFLAGIAETAGRSARGSRNAARMQADILEQSPEEESLPKLVWERGGTKASPKVLRLRLRGVISFSDERDDFLGIREKSPSSVLLTRIRQATVDDEIDGICLELDTPGGEVTAADVISDALCAFRESDTNRFVIVHMGSLCCSGGYYIAAAADCIVAHPTTTTGSIGVIMSTYNASELAKKIGVESVTIATGDNKDMLDPLKPVQPEHVEIFRKVVAADYERFLEVVSRGRDIPLEDVRRIADGRVLSAEEALTLKLIDAIGYRDDVYDIMNKLVGRDVAVYRYEEDVSLRGLISGLFSAHASSRAVSAFFERMVPSVDAPRIEYRLH